MSPPERRPRALLVDLDGTLADSHGTLRCCFDDFLAARGVDATDEAFAALDGAPLRQIVAALRDTHGLSGSVDELLAEYESALHEAYPRSRPFDGAHELLRGARTAQMAVVLVTSAPAALAHAFLDTNALTEHFDGVVSGDDGPTKPDPAPFRAAAARVGVAVDDAVALEDAPNGVWAACAAGVPTIGIAADPARADALKAAGATLVVAGLREAATALGFDSPEPSP